MAEGRWGAEKAREWYEKTGWQMGMNYLPASAVNTTEMFRRETFDPGRIRKELGWARACGYTSLRVFLPFIVWDREREGFLETLDGFLAAAGERGLNVMPVLFDDCAFDHGQDPVYGEQPDPIPGVHNGRWTPSPGSAAADDPQREPDLRDYVRAVVGRYRSDGRILAWDLYNEPGNSGRGSESLPLLESAFRWARECAPEQPLTAGVWRDSFDTPEQAACLELSDVVSFHCYKDLARQREVLSLLSGLRRPLFVTEWLCRELGCRVETHLPFYREHGISCWNWGFVRGRTQTNLWWGDRRTDPDPWQHDILDTDGTPYRREETELLRRFGKPRGTAPDVQTVQQIP